jgi:hypothetical protein
MIQITKPKNCRLANWPEDNAARVKTQGVQTVHQPQQRPFHWPTDTLKSKFLATQASVLKWACTYLQKRSLTLLTFK